MDTSSAEHAGKGRELCLCVCVNVPACFKMFEHSCFNLFLSFSGSSM